MKRFFTLRRIVWALVGLVTLYCLFVTIENWTGARALAAAKEMLAKEGETLDFQKLIHPPIPDGTNFCAIEPLKGITQLYHADGEPESAKETALKSINWYPTREIKLRAPTLGKGYDLGKPIDLAEWTKFLSGSRFITASAKATPAEVLAALDREKPLLRELAAAAVTRRDAAFTPPVGPEPGETLFTMRMPHLTFAQRLGQALALRAEYALAAGNTTEAIRSIQAGLRLTRATGRDAILISLLVSATVHSMNEQSIWSLLSYERATEEQLATLQVDLEQLDFLAANLLALRVELTGGYDMIQHMKAHPGDFGQLLGATGGVNLRPWISKLGFSIIPSGWLDHSAAHLIQVEHDLLVRPAKTGSHEVFLAAAKDMDALAQKNPLLHPHDILARIAVPALSQVTHRVFYVEAIHRQSIIAVALERHRLRYQKYPAALAELVPAFLKTVPADTIDGLPMRYRVKEDGHCEIWSIAADREDDHGQAPTETKDIAKPSYAGDWVWRVADR